MANRSTPKNHLGDIREGEIMTKKAPSSKIGTIALSLSAMFITLLIQIGLLSEIGIKIFTEKEIGILMGQHGPYGLIFLPFNRLIFVIFLISLLLMHKNSFKDMPLNLPLFISRVIRGINIYLAIFAALSLWILAEEYVASAFWVTFVFLACYYLHHDFIIECVAINGKAEILKKSMEQLLEGRKLKLSVAGVNPNNMNIEASSGNINVNEMIIEKDYSVFNMELRDSRVELEIKRARGSHKELLASYVVTSEEEKEFVDIEIEIRDKHKELFKDTVTVDRDMSLREVLEELSETYINTPTKIVGVHHNGEGGEKLDLGKTCKDLGLWDGDRIYVKVEVRG